MIDLKRVTIPDDVAKSLARFNRQARRDSERAHVVLRQTKYWVYDAASDSVGPGKFVGFAGMDIKTYSRANAGEPTSIKFDGHVTKVAIERALDDRFSPRPPLVEKLRAWGTSLLGKGAFGGADDSKWLFLQLPGDARPPEEEAAAGAAEEEVERTRGQGFVITAAARKAIERHAMDNAIAYFEAEGCEVEDVCSRRPYDLHCTKPREVLHVEVKGTQTLGDQVVLTRGEVEFARRHRPETAIFVLHSVALNGGGPAPRVTGGQRHVISPWDPDEAELTPLARVHGSIRFPAKFMLVAAMNPTPSGYNSDNPKVREKYLAKLSGPLLDRIDLHVEVPAVPYRELTGRQSGTNSASMREQVMRARQVQSKRFGDGTSNARMDSRQMKKFCDLSDGCLLLMKQAMDELGLSARAYDKVRRVARTIADMEGTEHIGEQHVAEAVQYRLLDRKF
jgi:hypothetical protein